MKTETIKVKATVASTAIERVNERFTAEALGDIAAQAKDKQIFWAFDYERPCGKILSSLLVDDHVVVEAELHGVDGIAFGKLLEEKIRIGDPVPGFIVPGFRVLEAENEVGNVARPFIRTIKRLHLAAFGLVPEPSDQSLEIRIPFIQSCEHGKLSGQRCRECNRNVPYGPKPE